MPASLAPRRAARTALLMLALAAAIGCSAPSSRPGRPVSSPAAVAAASADIHWREYRLPLRPERLANAGSAATSFWEIAAPLAERHGASVERKRGALKPSRSEVVRLDTADARLETLGLELRKRGRADAPGGAVNFEFTIESRATDAAVAHASRLEAAPGRPSTLRFKEEVLIDPARPGGMRSVFALESMVRTSDRPLDLRIADVVDLFPGTATSLGDPGTGVAPVDGGHVEQTEIELGAIRFAAGTTVRPSLLVYRDRRSGEVLAGEYTFSERIADYHGQPPADVAALRAYFTALQAEARDWVSISGNGAFAGGGRGTGG